jgi:hypothetical protein
MFDYLMICMMCMMFSGVLWAAFYCGYRIQKPPKDDLTMAPAMAPASPCYASYFDQLKALKVKDGRELVIYTQRGHWYDTNAVLAMGLEIGRDLTEIGISIPEVTLWDDGRRFRWVFEDEKSAFTFKMKFSSEIVEPPYEGFVS